MPSLAADGRQIVIVLPAALFLRHRRAYHIGQVVCHAVPFALSDWQDRSTERAGCTVWA